MIRQLQIRLAAVTIAAAVCLLGSGCATYYKNEDLIAEFEKYGLEAQETMRGVVVYIPDIFFEFDKDTLTPSARTKVQDVAIVLTNRRALNRKMAIEGHTDSIGEEAYNLDLSQRRADTVSDELTFSKVAGERITVNSYGEKVPVAPNRNPDGSDNPQGREKNRQVEVIILND